jgi:hypothetical protein
LRDFLPDFNLDWDLDLDLDFNPKSKTCTVGVSLAFGGSVQNLKFRQPIKAG